MAIPSKTHTGARAQSSRPLIFTDLDGSLLDHYTYQWTPAAELLNDLKTANVPIIPVTSKTCAEVLSLRSELDNQHPFVTENGAAIYIPQDYFPNQPRECQQKNDFWVVEKSRPRDHWVALLEKLSDEFSGSYQSFYQAGVEGIIEMTGLSENAAWAANQREYSEPVAWLGSDEKKQAFITKLQALGAHVLQGGRFLSISDNCNKGIAVRWLQDEFARQNKSTQFLSLAIGDNQNDIAMLESADHALIIRSPTHSPPALTRTKGVTYSRSEGPVGWQQGVSEWLATHFKQSGPFGNSYTIR